MTTTTLSWTDAPPSVRPDGETVTVVWVVADQDDDDFERLAQLAEMEFEQGFDVDGYDGEVWG